MWKIQMKEGSNWVTLGGTWGGDDVGTRMSQFQDHFMCREIPKKPNSPLVCKREFRSIRV